MVHRILQIRAWNILVILQHHQLTDCLAEKAWRHLVTDLLRCPFVQRNHWRSRDGRTRWRSCAKQTWENKPRARCSPRRRLTVNHKTDWLISGSTFCRSWDAGCCRGQGQCFEAPRCTRGADSSKRPREIQFRFVVSGARTAHKRCYDEIGSITEGFNEQSLLYLIEYGNLKRSEMDLSLFCRIDKRLLAS